MGAVDTAPVAASVMRAAFVAEATEPAVAVWYRMQREHAMHVVVRRDGRYLGVVDLHDVWVSWALDLERGAHHEVVRLVTAAPAVGPTATLRSVCRALCSSRHGAVLVLDDEGSLLGLVTTADVVRSLADED